MARVVRRQILTWRPFYAEETLMTEQSKDRIAVFFLPAVILGLILIGWLVLAWNVHL